MRSLDPYSLIQRTARRARRRRRFELVLPALPPAAAVVGALLVGRLPIEVTAASVIALGLLSLHVTALVVSRESAAVVLDRQLGAKDHFLTLATLENPASDFQAVVESEAVALSSSSDSAGLPSPPRRPVILSSLLSILGFLLLWVLPDLPAAAPRDPLARLEGIAAELAASPSREDRQLAKQLRDVVKALHDPELSTEEKREKVDEARAKLEKDSPPQPSAGSSGGKQQTQQKSDQGGDKAGGGNEKGAGSGTAGQNPDKQGGAQGSSESGALKGQAKSELAKIAGELGGEQKQAKSEAGKGGQEKPKQQPSGGGIKGPESGGKQAEQDGSGSEQSGADPNKAGDRQKPGDAAQGEAKQPREAGAEPSAEAAGKRGQGGEGGSAGAKPLPSTDGKAAERYYKPGEGVGGSRIEDGKYIRVRLPEEAEPGLGTEIVAKPGEVEPEIPYGNAPLPSTGEPGEAAIDQPQPLEYREALRAAQK